MNYSLLPRMTPLHLRTMFSANQIFSLALILSTSVAIRWYYLRLRRAIPRGVSQPKMRKGKYIFGLENVVLAMQAMVSKSLPVLIDTWFSEHGHTFAVDRLGTRIIFTCSQQNIETILATQMKEFSVGLDRRLLHALLGTGGIFTQDGAKWAHSRALLRPSFTRTQVANLGALETVLQTLIIHLRRAKGPVDLHPLFVRLTMDVSTDFLLGASVRTLAKSTCIYTRDSKGKAEDAPGSAFSDAFNTAQGYTPWRVILGEFYWLMSPPKFRKACRIVHEYVGKYANLALEKRRMQGGKRSDKYIFLEALAAESEPPAVMKDQVLSVLMAGRDPSAALLSWTIKCLVQNPLVLHKLRQEIEEINHGSGLLMVDAVSKMKYLQWVLYEVLRLYPPVPFNARTAIRTTTLPFGGGENGEMPIIVRTGDKVMYSIYSLHRRKDLYGDDAGAFRPERWENRTRGWDWLPFGGGPRTCLGQHMAMLQTGYVIVRLLQEFRCLEAAWTMGRDVFDLGIVMAPADGVMVRLS